MNQNPQDKPESEAVGSIAEIKTARELVDYGETLLCNVTPMPHCSHLDWGRYLKHWRDAKHALFPDGSEPRSEGVQIDRLRAKVEELEKACIPLEDKILQLAGENEELEKRNAELLGTGNSWPLVDVLSSLRSAARHLLYDHACDHIGHETISGNVNRAQAFIELLQSTNPVQGWVRVGEVEKTVKLLELLSHPKTRPEGLWDISHELTRLTALIDANK